jgi:uncharacterized glyoxalase superfamily protein PhnB
MLTELRPMLQTEDYQGTLDFYTHVLGFTIHSQAPEIGWASLVKDKVALMISRPGDLSKFDGSKLTGSIYFNTDDVEALWNELKDKARVCYPIETFEYDMREFGIYDNNGYILNFGQDVRKE